MSLEGKVSEIRTRERRLSTKVRRARTETTDVESARVVPLRYVYGFEGTLGFDGTVESISEGTGSIGISSAWSHHGSYSLRATYTRTQFGSTDSTLYAYKTFNFGSTVFFYFLVRFGNNELSGNPAEFFSIEGASDYLLYATETWNATNVRVVNITAYPALGFNSFTIPVGNTLELYGYVTKGSSGQVYIHAENLTTSTVLSEQTIDTNNSAAGDPDEIRLGMIGSAGYEDTRTNYFDCVRIWTSSITEDPFG